MSYHKIVLTRRGVGRRPRLAGSVRLEKVFDKYYTYYPEASGLPEYADMSFYVMVHESFNPSLTSRADNVYANRKPRKRHTFDTVRLFYEGIGIGLRKQEDVT